MELDMDNTITNGKSKRLTIGQQLILKKKIDSLSESRCVELFEIIKRYTEQYTINKNGVFLNLKTASDELLEQIQKFINYIDSVNQTLNEKRF